MALLHKVVRKAWFSNIIPEWRSQYIIHRSTNRSIYNRALINRRNVAT